MNKNTERAVLAGGCFWIMQQLLRGRDGVISTRVGWIGGKNENPTEKNNVGHAEAVNIEFEKPITVEEARSVLREAPGVMVVDKREPGGYVTPVEAAGEFATFVSRIREDATVENGLAMWIVADNLLKGAALNAIQIAETMINRNLLPKAA